MLSRCVATDTGAFATDYWGRQPLLSRTTALPRDFSDLLSPTAVDELIAERGVRAPFIRMAKTGDVLARSCYTGPAGFGAEMPDQVVWLPMRSPGSEIRSQLGTGPGGVVTLSVSSPARTTPAVGAA